MCELLDLLEQNLEPFDFAGGAEESHTVAAREGEKPKGLGNTWDASRSQRVFSLTVQWQPLTRLCRDT
jgi:hypothetical protein